jgi:lipopolysaccharide biosynthesis protein
VATNGRQGDAPRPDALPSDGLIEALREENDALRLRVAYLDETVAEYRRQMSKVLNSASWRVTSPIRMAAGRGRLLKQRARRLPRRLMTGRERMTGSPTAGLFAPAAPVGNALVSADSPLFANPGRATRSGLQLRRDLDASRNRILVVAHVYYPEVWLDIEDRLARLPEPYDLVVALVEGRALGLEAEIKRRLPHARIHHVANYGRDFGSLVELANLGVFDGYDAVLKVHTKRSPHRLDGDAWRVSLLDGVLPSPGDVRRILELLRSDRDVGLVVPTGSLMGPETWGSDRELVEALAARVPLAFDPDRLLYAAGSMYWVKPFVLQRLADLALDVEHFENEADHLDGSTAHALERYVGIVTAASGLDLVEAADVPSRLSRARRSRRRDPRVLAFYLPQYHPSPENDAWWGRGFTDWMNVDKARPLFAGHVQPQLPGELGHYDLSDPSVLRAQASLARAYGVSGFVMYHYWFNGKRLLDKPLRALLKDPSIDFPFALCWANENWTRSWDGLDDEVLIGQRYLDGWADDFYDDIAPALLDSRYIAVGGRRLLLVYRPGLLRDGRAALERWRARAREDGLGEMQILGVVPSRDFEAIPADVGAALDGLVRFPPGSGLGLQSVRELAPDLASSFSGDVFSYEAAVDGADLSTSGKWGLPVYPGVMPGWDNTARRGDASYVFHGSNPATFRRWLARAADAAAALRPEPLVFVNAWNEWAEGAHLEPDMRFGRGNLEAVRDVAGAAALASSDERKAAEVVSLLDPHPSDPIAVARVAR